MPRKFTLSPEAKATRKARAREIRDLNDRLRKKYRQSVVDQFFRDNYFLQPGTVEEIIRESDDQPVDLQTASLIYRVAMQETFYL